MNATRIGILFSSLLISSVVSSCTTTSRASQDQDPDQRRDPIDRFDSVLHDEGIRLRRRPGGAHELKQPAQFSAVKATGTPNSQVSIDAGLNWDASFLQFSDDVVLSLIAEMHKNTAFPQKQEAYQFGVMGSNVLVDGTDMKLLLDTTAALKTDKYTDYGLFAKAAFTAVIPELGAGEMLTWDDNALQWTPQMGFNYELAEDVFASDLLGPPKNGDAFRFFASVAADFYPSRSATDGRLWVHTEFTYWGQVFESGGFKRTSDNEHLFRTAVNYGLNASGTVVLGIEFGSGGNPEIGLRHEDYLMLNLGVLLGDTQGK
jgi:hypothetical protein